MEYTYYPKGVCSNKIDIDVEGNIIKNVKFYGGCDGNLKALSKLVKGMTVESVSEILSGNTDVYKRQAQHHLKSCTEFLPCIPAFFRSPAPRACLSAS